MSDRVPVKFLQSHDKWNKGEVAGFFPAVAQQLIDKDVALAWSEEEDAKAKLAEAAAATRAQDLDAREADVAARLADLEAREARLAKLEEGAPPKPKAAKADAAPAT